MIYSASEINDLFNAYRNTVTQTKKDGSSSVPNPSTYIAGIRGRNDFSKKVDLTLTNEMHNNITT